MRYLCLFSLCFFTVFTTTAQNRFKQKDFNQLLRLTQQWELVTSSEEHIFEDWTVVDDSTLQGNTYRSVSDTLSPSAALQLKLRDQHIFLEYTDLTETPDSRKTYMLTLKDITKNEFLFENNESEEQRRAEKAGKKIPVAQRYEFTAKKGIMASFQWLDITGMKTIRYMFRKPKA